MMLVLKLKPLFVEKLHQSIKSQFKVSHYVKECTKNFCHLALL